MKKGMALVRRFKVMKTLPHVALRLSRLKALENTSMKEIEEIIRMDPTLVLRLLRLVNSPYYGIQHKVDNISRAVILIGMKNLRNLLLVDALHEIFKNDTHGGIFSGPKLWLHCAAVSIMSQMISERIFKQNGEDAFLCGILHDIGLIVEYQVAQDAFLKFCQAYQKNGKPIIEYERDLIGTDHCMVGSLLTKEWKMPETIQNVIKQHHKNLEDISPSSLTGIIQIAEYIVSKLEYTALPGVNGSLSPPLDNHIRENFEKYMVLTSEFSDELAKAKELYEPQAQEA